MGFMIDNCMIVGSRASGAVSNGGAMVDYMGGLIGRIGYGLVRDTQSSASICDGSGANCDTASGGNDAIGALIGFVHGHDAADRKQYPKFAGHRCRAWT